ncbi:MAG: RagB/SusD family nutrient uptake outer membrane protein, partial [Bacteroidota bacterium]
MKLQKILIAFALLSVFGCTDLEETLREDLSAEAANELLLESADVSALLKAVYDGLQLPYQDQARVFAAQQHTSDETIGPTRGP